MAMPSACAVRGGVLRARPSMRGRDEGPDLVLAGARALFGGPGCRAPVEVLIDVETVPVPSAGDGARNRRGGRRTNSLAPPAGDGAASAPRDPPGGRDRDARSRGRTRLVRRVGLLGLVRARRVQICHKGTESRYRRRRKARNLNDSPRALPQDPGLCGRFGQSSL